MTAEGEMPVLLLRLLLKPKGCAVVEVINVMLRFPCRSVEAACALVLLYPNPDGRLVGEGCAMDEVEVSISRHESTLRQGR